jgi:hypothetical protein
MTPEERLMDEVSKVVSDSAAYGMTFDGTAPVLMQLAIKLTQKAIGDEATAIVLRNAADRIEAAPDKPHFVIIEGGKTDE